MPKIGITLEDVLRRSKKQSKRKNYRGWAQSFGGLAPINNAFFNMAMGNNSEPCCGGEADGGVGMVGSVGESLYYDNSQGWHKQIVEDDIGSFIIDTYKSRGGRDFVSDFIDNDLDKISRTVVENDLLELRRLGNNARPPLSKHIDDGIFEFRSTTPMGKVRILYFFAPGRIILLTNGIVKKQSELPKEEIIVAKSRRKDYLSRIGGQDGLVR